MRNTPIHLPVLYLELIDKIVSDKNYHCKSEFIRCAIRQMLKRDFKLLMNPALEKSSEQIHQLMEKRTDANFQRKIDQFQALFQLNPSVEKESKEKRVPQGKQARIDQYWK